MSLLVHLPFIEDLRSKGLIELPSFSRNSFTSNANGKLGSCYSGYGVISLPEEILGNAWSVATWVKSTATWPTTNYIIFCKNISAATDCQIYFSIINGTSLNLGMNDDYMVDRCSYTFELDIWYHVAATYDGETYRLYINGAEVKSGTSTLPMVENRLHLGIGCRSSNAAGTSATGADDGKFFNDFRLYNNAISAREVKELSKGLVAHWKLDDLIGLDKIYDSSGYGHDGTLSPNPPINDADSVRYSGCTAFASSSQNYIDLGLDTWLPTEQISVSWWGYMTSWSSYGRAISCTESGGWNFQPSSGKMVFPLYKTGFEYTRAYSTTPLANLSSGWHHFVGTFDGYATRIYIDGEYDGISTDSSPDVKTTIKYTARAKLFIGCEPSGANPYTPYFNGKLSDIRIYATALSAEDIKELYNTSASIDNHHNVYAREFVEA